MDFRQEMDEALARMIDAAKRAGAREAVSRIRRELLALVNASPAGPPHLYRETIDHICPEGGES